MRALVLNEAGYEEAMVGISLSWASNPGRAKEIAPKLAHKQGGHNKFLESMMMWLDVDAPRYWWQEFDTYRVGVSKQSESTMHTITKRTLGPGDVHPETAPEVVRTLYGWMLDKDFEDTVHPKVIAAVNELIEEYLYVDDVEHRKALFLQIKASLPEGFLQRRIVCMSYKTLQNMYAQRKNHRLPEWSIFFDGVFDELQHKEFIVEVK